MSCSRSGKGFWCFRATEGKIGRGRKLRGGYSGCFLELRRSRRRKRRRGCR